MLMSEVLKKHSYIVGIRPIMPKWPALAATTCRYGIVLPKNEHLAVLQSAGIFDTSHMAIVAVKGGESFYCFRIV
jgi:hypothetical protein